MFFYFTFPFHLAKVNYIVSGDGIFQFSHLFNYLFVFGFTDPYLNTDAGTMSPFEHGEVFVLDDGGEVNATLKPLFCLLNLNPEPLYS